MMPSHTPASATAWTRIRVASGRARMMATALLTAPSIGVPAHSSSPVSQHSIHNSLLPHNAFLVAYFTLQSDMQPVKCGYIYDLYLLLCVCGVIISGRNCETEVNICSTANPCENGATCQVVDTTFICQCPFGFTGRTCSSRKLKI